MDLAKEPMSYAYWVKHNCPHRFPRDLHYETAILLVSRHGHIHANPLAAIEIIGQRHPAEIIL
jgi:hypothetical protein